MAAQAWSWLQGSIIWHFSLVKHHCKMLPCDFEPQLTGVSVTIMLESNYLPWLFRSCQLWQLTWPHYWPSGQSWQPHPSWWLNTGAGRGVSACRVLTASSAWRTSLIWGLACLRKICHTFAPQNLQKTDRWSSKTCIGPREGAMSCRTCRWMRTIFGVV